MSSLLSEDLEVVQSLVEVLFAETPKTVKITLKITLLLAVNL